MENTFALLLHVCNTVCLCWQVIMAQCFLWWPIQSYNLWRPWCLMLLYVLYINFTSLHYKTVNVLLSCMLLKVAKHSFKVSMPNSPFFFLTTYAWALVFYKVNHRRVRCVLIPWQRGWLNFVYLKKIRSLDLLTTSSHKIPSISTVLVKFWQGRFP